ncbi:AAA family ATPase [Burkholderia vietnamiensis]|uniref:AAA family ATPase n=1 Tax=Burkholderia vietnamiensis TaxID=60552 RepID=A0AAW7T9B2_BURVI|nr:AAA family ATPase [Burkholderia vietnamiensis]MDN7798174.1 AAA family ATPase [Burkholderia vietnamiensis]HDR9074698.1 AAA family ATPase [Burkholderia vietnamiensis]HDR9190528.1 AAA family ATPase [Burkholderia vietnamiensis]
MQIKRIEIENYRSLRHVVFEPNDLTVIVGANGSGKSNVASAFEFLSDVYSTGLEYAVLNKGGFENVAFRRQRRTRSAVRFTIDFVLEDGAATLFAAPANRDRAPVRIRHIFAFGASKQTIRADYGITEERIEYYESKKNQRAVDYLSFSHGFTIEKIGTKVAYTEGLKRISNQVAPYVDFLNKRAKVSTLGLMIRELFWLNGSGLTGISVHQFSPQISRTPGAPSPLPKLTSYGQNLATLVDWLQRHHPSQWNKVESSMQEIIPGLQSIKVEFSTNNLLTLSFLEEGSSRPWSSQDVSDGTIQTLAILCCLSDPRVNLLFLEEPENSVHPWIVRQLAKQFKSHSEKTQTILTTHSPVILNVVTPDCVWICHKEQGETILSHLPVLYPSVAEDWANGEERLFELFDMGLVREAMPTGVMR